MTAQILNHPAKALEILQERRFRWLCEALYFKRSGDKDNLSYCQGRMASLNEAIHLMGGETISLQLDDYEEAA
jgi:hypothetical protein